MPAYEHVYRPAEADSRDLFCHHECGGCLTAQNYHRHRKQYVTLSMNVVNQNKVAVGSTLRSLQHCRLADKNSRNISHDNWNSSSHFRLFMYLLHDFSWNPG